MLLLSWRLASGSSVRRTIPVVKDLLKPHSILIVLGPGGVGKTTIAAALGVAAAGTQLNTAVITVDPARRLRDALGLPRLSGKPTRIEPRRLRAAGLDPALRLSAMVLDVKGQWDAMVAEHVADPAARRRILDNAFYRSLSSQFAGSDAYAALEALHDLHGAGRFDFEVVDTPPAAHAFEFVQAPARLVRLLDSQAARLLFAPGALSASLALRLAGRATRFVARELERFTGPSTLSSIAEFFAAAAGAAGAMAARMRKVEALLHSPAVRFALVTTAEPERLRQARRLVTEMEVEGLRLGAIVINRFIDEAVWRGPTGGGGIRLGVLDEIPALRAALGASPSSDDGVSAAAAYLENYRSRAQHDLRRVTRFAEEMGTRVRIATAPEIRPGTPSLVALGRLANFLSAPPITLARHERAGAPKGRAQDKPAGRADSSDAGVSL
jgi:anion-transporting  ArsA/GET3 family ATPase